MPTKIAQDFRAEIDAVHKTLLALPIELADTPWPRRGCTWRRFTGSMQLSNFEEYLDNNIVMVPHRQDLQFRVFASRLRRPGGPDQIVRINVELNRLEDVDN